MPRVTFSRMEPGAYAGDPGSMLIFLDGEEIGAIESEYTDISTGMDRAWRVSSYEVRFHDEALAADDRTFDFNPRDGIARTVLATVKDYVRDVIAEHL